MLREEFRKGINAELLSDYLKDQHAYKSFHRYLEIEHSEENLDFWQDVRSRIVLCIGMVLVQIKVERLARLLPGSPEMKALLTEMLNLYIVADAPKMINVSAKVTAEIKQNVAEVLSLSYP